MRVLTTFLAVSVSSNCLAHRDMRIDVADDGQLIGLPDTFEPARLDVEFTSSQAIRAVKIRIGPNVLEIPRCLVGLLGSSKLEQIKVTASWYHDEKVIPYYLGINFYDNEFDSGRQYNRGYSFLFNLHSVRLLWLHAMVVGEADRSVSNEPVAIKEICQKKELESILDSDFR